MPSVRPRPVEDSRSESSSTITNVKDRAIAAPVPTSTLPKGKKVASAPVAVPVTAAKPTVNGIATAPPELDPSLPRTDWLSFPPHLLHLYRHAHHLPTPSSYTNSHADLLYKSSETGLRAPSQVLARRRLRDLKIERRKASHSNGKPKDKSSSIHKDRDWSKDRLKNGLGAPASSSQYSGLINQSIEHTEDALRQTPASLALAVRRHFNAQQLNESDVLARFLYVVHHSSRSSSRQTIVDGSDGDGKGVSMGSHGRAVPRNDGASGGGELGFRLRFRPQ